MLRLGFVGFGEAAFYISAGLAGEGLRDIVAYDVAWQTPPYAEQITARARSAGVRLVPDVAALADAAGIILSATSAAQAVPVARACAPYLRDKLYADVNAASPVTMETVDRIVGEAGGRFVDVAMMGPLSKFGHKIPMIASGQAADEFCEALAAYGMVISVVGDAPGRASAIKMFRSIVIKGLEGLALEMMVAAHRFGAEDAVLDSIAESTGLSGFKKFMQELICADAVHSGRRMHEMEEVIATLEEMGLDPVMARATRAKLSWSASLGLKRHFKGEWPSSYLDVMDAIAALAPDTGKA